MNRKHITLSICTLAGLTAIMCSATKSAMAQTRPALVKSVDEMGRNPYQATVPCIVGFRTDQCFARLDPVPTGKRLILLSVSAILFPNNVLPIDVRLANEPSTLAAFVPTKAPSGYVVVNSPILLYVEPSKSIYLTAFNVVSFETGHVTFTGYLVDIE